MAILKHIASKNADYGKSLEYVMFQHTENGIPIRDDEGNMLMRESFLLDGINCTPFSYDKECEMVNANFHKNRKYSDIKSHHYIISFDPQDGFDGLLTPEKAHALGIKFARTHFPGHQTLVCTHDDGHNESGNIHVHIIFNSVRKLDVEKQPFMEREIDCRAGYKHHLTKGYLEYLQTELMKLCEREGLHQVDLHGPAKSKITDREYRVKQRGQKKLDELNEEIIAAKMKPRTTIFQTQKQYLRDAISEASVQAASLDEFQRLLKGKYGIEVKESRGRFSYLHPERSKFITGCALGSDFEKNHIAQIIQENNHVNNQEISDQKVTNTQDYVPKSKPAGNDSVTGSDNIASRKDYDPTYDYHADPIAILYVRSHLRLVVDLQTNIKAMQSVAYAQKVKLSNLKEMARTVVYIQEHGFDTIEDLQNHNQTISEKKTFAQEALVQTDVRIKEINQQIHFTGQYYATRQVQKDFLNARFKKKFRVDHQEDLDQYHEAVSFFKKHNSGRVPVMKNLKSEKEKLLTLQSEQRKELSGFEQMENELQIAVSNVRTILLHTDSTLKSQIRRNQPEL